LSSLNASALRLAVTVASSPARSPIASNSSAARRFSSEKTQRRGFRFGGRVRWGRGGERELVVRLVERDCHLESVEDLDQLVRRRGSERRSKGRGRRRAAPRSRRGVPSDGRASSARMASSIGRRLLSSSMRVPSLRRRRGGALVVLLPLGRDASREVVTQQPQAAGTEETLRAPARVLQRRALRYSTCLRSFGPGRRSTYAIWQM